MTTAKQPPKKRKGMGWKGKTLIGLGITFGAVGGGVYYMGEKALEMEAQIDQTNFDEVCVTVGEPADLATNPLMNVFNNDLAKIFNAVQASPLGKQLYDYADAADLKTCYLDDIAQEIHANAFFLGQKEDAHIGYSLDMITSSTHSAAETTGHEFFHFYQHENAYASRYLPGNAGAADKLLRMMVTEAAAKTVGTLVLYEIDVSPAETVHSWRLNSDDRTNLSWYKKFLKKYEDQPIEEAKLHAAQDMMRHLLLGDVLQDGWRAHYLKYLYLTALHPENDQEKPPADDVIFTELLQELTKDRQIHYRADQLAQLATLPDGRNLLPENINYSDVIDTMINTVKEMVESYELWPDEKDRPDGTPRLAQASDNDNTAGTVAASWRQRLSR